METIERIEGNKIICQSGLEINAISIIGTIGFGDIITGIKTFPRGDCEFIINNTHKKRLFCKITEERKLKIQQILNN